ncbi:HipA family kinase [Mariniflexile gromovii]|uniref:HipA-like kinase domain-containing protein n=1 Tax=Mariniflexile gromovii TaxID=362523 RepID=A0ABS4BW21_9FLAO|nr:HipA family kinase [Mariniflexile gromovii]MBP0904784.1 hypothetical protein [Mariniflexile gromovii]
MKKKLYILNFLEEIKHITAVQILEQQGTNSVPFFVLCDDGELYIAKTMFKSHPPFADIINEILCVYFLEQMGVKTIKPALISVPQEVYDSFKLTGKLFDIKYDNLIFNNTIFFGSLFQPTTTEAELYNISLKNKFDYNRYINPIDFLKIGVFDNWIANMDRRGSNPNILINESINGKFEFLPIDHVQAFAYQNNYKALRLALMSSSNPKSILNTPMSKSILKFADSNFIANFHIDLIESFDKVIKNMDFVFNQIPNSFGLSKNGKMKIKEILSNKERNIQISKIYLNYIK